MKEYSYREKQILNDAFLAQKISERLQKIFEMNVEKLEYKELIDLCEYEARNMVMLVLERKQELELLEDIPF